MLHQGLFLRQSLIQTVTAETVIHQDFSLGRQILQPGHDAAIFLHLDTLLIQIRPHALIQSALLYKQHTALLRQITIGNRHRITFHVASPDIEKPHQIVQLGQEKSVRPFFFQLLHDIRPLLLKSPARNFLVQHSDFSRRKLRPV